MRVRAIGLNRADLLQALLLLQDPLRIFQGLNLQAKSMLSAHSCKPDSLASE